MAKKTFLQGNPALQFISGATDQAQHQEAAQPQPAEAPEGYKVNPLYIETKSRRLQLIVQPSLYNRIKAGADAAGLSVNEYIHQILDKNI
jgi:predicted DNA binding CopG/RHH family protein